MNLAQTILRPVLTEKSVSQEAVNKYTFVVHADATKVDVKQALKALYGVQVAKVNILHNRVKSRIGRSRMPMQKRANTRRAIITLKAGEKLEITKLKAEPAKKAKTPKKAEAAASN